MKLYKMIWYLSDRSALGGLEHSYEKLIDLINKSYKVENESLRS